MEELTPNQFCIACSRGNTPDQYPHHLRPGTVLNGKYLVGNCLGEGGFGITYIGRDLALDIKVAIKEYYPNGYVNRNNLSTQLVTATSDHQREIFDHGKSNFLMEARSLAKFIGEPGIVDVRDYFEANNTTYIIMEYLEGESLSSYIKMNGIMAPETAFDMIRPVVKSLEKIHRQGIIHRDISPDNIMLTKENRLVLMDFGSARFFSNRDKEMSILLKQGYAPEEQYRKNGDQGPWTDVYGLCATLYKCITGVAPEDALDRLRQDNLKRPSQLGIRISEPLENVLMYGLAVYHENRCRDMAQLSSMIRDALDHQNVYAAAQNAAPYAAQPFVDQYQQASYPADRQPMYQANQQPVYQDQYQQPVYQDQYQQPTYHDQYQQAYQQPSYQNSKTPLPVPEKKPPSMKAVVAVVVASAVVIVGVMTAIIIMLLNRTNTVTTADDNALSSSTASVSAATAVDDREESMNEDENEASSKADDAEKEKEAVAAIVMPSCKNKKLSQAEAELKKLGLKVKVTYQNDNSVAKDYVINQSPSNGTELSKGDTVALVVSKGSAECPYSYSQKVVVTASGSYGTLTLYEWKDGDFKKSVSYDCAVGSNGIGPSMERTSTTPQGEFDLGILFVTRTPNSKYTNYYIATKDTCVVDDVNSPDYNLIREGKPAGVHVDTSIGKGLTSGDLNAVIYIEHNGDGFSSQNVKKNKGSAIGLRGKYGSLSPTYGDVDISAADMSDLLSRLDSGKNPRIFIGV